MTKEEAIYRLKNMAWLYGSAEREQNIEAINMAIEALQTDAVSREDTVTLNSPISIQAPTGEWQKVDEQPYFRKHFDNVCCSVCHHKGMRKYNYCPNCGAKMKGGVE